MNPNPYLVSYLVIGLAWGIFAGWMQFKSGLSTRADWQLFLCVMANIIGWPVGMFCAWAARVSK